MPEPGAVCAAKMKRPKMRWLRNSSTVPFYTSSVFLHALARVYRGPDATVFEFEVFRFSTLFAKREFNEWGIVKNRYS